MGLLTDPHTGRGKLVKFVCKFHVTLCILLYIAAVIWLLILPHSNVSMGVHFSENALLPGLVKTEFSQEALAKDYYDELLHEMEKYKNSIPYPWLLAKFRQIGLDTYSHNFTLNYPLGKKQTFTGNNVYGILRAPRAASTESVVLSIPFRPPNSIHPTTAPSVAIMLAFAKFANKEKYWAKDIIFLVTEHEQLGIQAWLEAYHSHTIGEKGVLNSGDLRGRAGQIQAAINLEMNDLKIAVMDVKIEGLNGQLPNLDLVTLVNKMCIKEGLHVTFKNRGNANPQSDLYRHWRHSLRTMMSMILTQSTGIPNGNHGLFHQFGIQAVTMNGYLRQNTRGNQIGFFSMGKILEGIYRSLNNLLERFHQSYFFYLLPSNDRFVSIIWFMPVLSFLVGALLIRSLVQWYQVCYNPYCIQGSDNDFNKSKDKMNVDCNIDESKESSFTSSDVYKIFMLFFFTHIAGMMVMYSPKLISKYGAEYGYSTEVSIFYGFAVMGVALLILPFYYRLENHDSLVILNMFVIWELAMTFLGIGMINFSLGILCAFLYVPIVLLITPTLKKPRVIAQYLIWLLVHPFVIMIIVVMIYTFVMFPNMKLDEQIGMSMKAVKQALVFGIVDAIVYGNWVFKVACAVFLPIWLCMCCLLMSLPYKIDHSKTVDVNKLDKLQKEKAE